VLRSDFESVATIVRLDQQGSAPSSRLIVSPLWRWRQLQTRRIQFVPLGLFLKAVDDDGERATAEATDAAVGEGHQYSQKFS
jgi:hypothetical protein